ncbi:phd-finger domain-containing protein [Cystoisospora suis]|uniref:Phd-finger domain-containing protein n=1 Tax=Cystoisospora suis TaxID=483139 RepID=A0A2C6KSB7_9APIC|nr:phd-finger domain-containing protein [Cystoisospora suis]
MKTVPLSWVPTKSEERPVSLFLSCLLCSLPLPIRSLSLIGANNFWKKRSGTCWLLFSVLYIFSFLLYIYLYTGRGEKKMMVNPSNDGDSAAGGEGGGGKPGEGGGEEEERGRRKGISAASNYRRHSRSNSSCVIINKENRTGEEEDKTGCISDDDEDASIESNDSICFYCGGGGEIICCEGCPYSFHSDCLQPSARPQQKIHSSSLGRKSSHGNEEDEDGEEEDWFCPECLTRFFRNLSKESYLSLSPPPLPSRNVSFAPAASSSSPSPFSSSASSSSLSETTMITMVKETVEEKTDGRTSRLEHPFTSTTLSREDEDTTLLFNSPPNQQLLQDSLSWATLPSHLKSILKLHHKRKAALLPVSPRDHLLSSENTTGSHPHICRGRSPSEDFHKKVEKRHNPFSSSSPLSSSSSTRLLREEEGEQRTVNEEEEAEEKRRGDFREREASPMISVQGVTDGKLHSLKKRRTEKEEEDNDEEEREGEDYPQEVCSSPFSLIERQRQGSLQTPSVKEREREDEQRKLIGSSSPTSEKSSRGKASSSVESGREECSKADIQPSSSFIENRSEETTERRERETEGEDKHEGKQHGVSTPGKTKDRDHSDEKEEETKLKTTDGEKQGERKEKQGENKENDGMGRGSDEGKALKGAGHAGEEGDFEDISVIHHRASCSVRTPGVDDHGTDLASPQLSSNSTGDSSSPKQMEKMMSSLSTSFVEQQCQARPDSGCAASPCSYTSSSPPSSQGGSSEPSSSSSTSSSRNSYQGPSPNDPHSALPPTRRSSSSSSQPVTSLSGPSSSSTATGGLQSPPPTSAYSAPPLPFCSPFSSSSFFTRHPSIPYPYAYPPPAPYADEELPTFARRRRKKGGSGSRINVGPDHQVPQLPSFYLAHATDVFMSSITSNESSLGIFTSAYNPLCCIYCGGGIGAEGRESRGSEGCLRPNSRSCHAKGEDDDEDGTSCKKEKIRKRILNGYPLLPWDICPYCCRFSSAFFSVDIRTPLPFYRQYSHSSSILKEGVLVSPPLTYPSPPSCSYFSTLFSPPLYTFASPFPPLAPPLSFSASLSSHLSRSSSPPTSSAFIRRPFPDPNLHRKKTFSSRAENVGEKFSSSFPSGSCSSAPSSSSYSSLTSKKGDCVSSTTTTHHSLSPLSAPLPSHTSSSLLRSQSLPGGGFLSIAAPAEQGLYQSLLEPTLVYSPSSLERKRKLCTALGRSDNCINTQTDLAEFIATCSRHWKASPGWQPFTPEFAYKLLHRAEYDPERALRMLDDSAFSFNDICDPPLRRYDNKWKRRDKRGTYPCSPYPSPAVIRHYLGERLHTKHHRTL